MGLTQEKMAAMIGIKRSLLGAYEEARADPRLNNLQNMAEVFGVSVDSLMNEDLTSNSEDALPTKSHQTERKFDAPRPRPEPLPRYTTPMQPTYTPPPTPPQPVRQAPSPMPQSRYNAHNQEYAEAKKIRVLSVTVDNNNQENIEYVTQNNVPAYLKGFASPEFLEKLPKFSLPTLPQGQVYRAFEAGNETMLSIPKGTVVIGSYVRNWYNLISGKIYILVTARHGIICKWITNQIQENGTFLLSSDNPEFEDYGVLADDVLEIWEAKMFISMQLPEIDMSLQKLTSIVLDLQQEMMKMRKQQQQPPRY
ncbi:Helix-turn-helix [Flexibacter flexilis DSM 6793]|uniref:Helix-turn-helix n=2 Tax=Flexibacter flexilis TaxID=998 RepID=A0A1I1LI66_9BACT|nr:Helix-turn-helix [Flexibacter flexilis DSM 6793]